MNTRVKELETIIRRLKAHSEGATVVSRCNYIVTIGGLYVSFKSKNNEIKQGARPIHITTDPLAVTRYEYDDAVTVANNVSNGAGKSGEAISLSDAVDKALAQAERALRFLRGA